MTLPTDPFEGHTPGEARVRVMLADENYPTAFERGALLHVQPDDYQRKTVINLLAMLDLSRAEVKRLREALSAALSTMEWAQEVVPEVVPGTNFQSDILLLRGALTPVKPEPEGEA